MSTNIYDPLYNKYYKWYLSICERNKINVQGLIKHHIDPKSFYTKYAKDGWKLGNPDIKNNIVFLTNKEHFICHWILTKCYEGLPKKKMCNAFLRMCKGNKTSKYYVIARNIWSENNKGVDNLFYGKHHTKETLQLISQKNKGNIAWNKGLEGNKGETNNSAKLTEKDVLSIRLLYAQKIPIYDERIGVIQGNGKIFPYERAFCFQLGLRYKVSHKTINLIIENKKWTYLL